MSDPVEEYESMNKEDMQSELLYLEDKVKNLEFIIEDEKIKDKNNKVFK